MILLKGNQQQPEAGSQQLSLSFVFLIVVEVSGIPQFSLAKQSVALVIS
jgi:F0F1-type ATP synthase membrane subunit c/vacuolar-type H+-ATPase subunit K